jgi:hypothetical protein
MQRTDSVPHATTYDTQKRACGDQDGFRARRALEAGVGVRLEGQAYYQCGHTYRLLC